MTRKNICFENFNLMLRSSCQSTIASMKTITKVRAKRPKKSKTKNKNLFIGFIGQGFVGGNMADDFENRGYKTARYSLDAKFLANGHIIKECDVVFIATPTPTTPTGFDYSSISQALSKVGTGKIAVIKSTILPGTTEILQKENPEITVLHSPEFLSEATAAHDTAFPTRNIIGVPQKTPRHDGAARLVLSILPDAPYELICSSRESELIKYGRNVLGYIRIVFTNILYDTASSLGADWSVIQKAMSADPDTGPTYMNPIHKSGRGAGGHCFIKDFAAFRKFFIENMEDSKGAVVLMAIEKKNLELLESTAKDLDLLAGVYGGGRAEINLARNAKSF